jgi:iron-sulfur cluster assembly accessory protein
LEPWKENTPMSLETQPIAALRPLRPPLPTLTSKAVEMVKTTRSQEGMDESYALRVAVMGGGCSGFQYAIARFRSGGPPDTTTVFEVEGLQVYVDPVSARYLDGVTIDYVFGMKAPASSSTIRAPPAPAAAARRSPSDSAPLPLN